MNVLRRMWRFSRALLTGKVDELGSPLATAGFNGDIKAIKALLDAGADINEGDTAPLHLAVIGGKAEAARLLLERGAKLDKPGLQQALALAEKMGHWEVIAVLREAGVWRDPNVEWNL